MILAILKKLGWKKLQVLARVTPKDRRLLVFGAFSGQHFGDNSGALYSYVIKNKPDGVRAVWLTDSPDVLNQVRDLGGEAYLKRSLPGIWLSLRANWVVTSHALEDALLFYPVPGYPKELYLHHGIPLRKGIFREKEKFYDIPPVNSNERFHCITVSTVTSDWAAQQQRKNIPVAESILKITGLPRNDRLFTKDDNRALKQKYSLGSFTVLYAPTWRRWEGTKFFPFPDQDLAGIVSFLKERKMTMVLRPHHTDLRRQENDAFWRTVKASGDVFKVITIFEEADVQGLLAAADCLITDYSSIHYDYLLTGRPMIYLPYDLPRYVQEMGEFNCDYEEFTPGPKPKTQAEFLLSLDQFSKGVDTFKESRRRVTELVHAYKDGHSCERVYAIIHDDISD